MRLARSKPRRRRVRARRVVTTGIALAAIAAAALMTRTRTNPPQLTRATAHSAPAQRAYLDPATGALREATPEELQEAAAAATAAAEPEPIVGANGTPGLKLPDDFSSYLVATKNADGTLSLRHATGPKEADRLVKSPGGLTADRKEARSDR